MPVVCPRRFTRFLGGAALAFVLLGAAPAVAQEEGFDNFDLENLDNVITSPLTTMPTSPIVRDANGRYFNYGGQTVALVGISGETIPHLIVTGNYPNGTNPRSSYCVYNFLPGSTTKRKYQECMDKMVADGLNLMRVWVSFNAKPTPVSGTNHHPFAYRDAGAGNGCPGNTTKSGWNLEEKNTSFFANLANVVADAQSRGIIVEVTMFVPADDEYAQLGPYWSTNNCQNKGFRVPNTTTQDGSYFYQADNTATNPFTAVHLDSDTDNRYMRETQVRVMQWVVDALSSYHNVFFELANEADLGGTDLGSFTNLINWHHYMAKKLYDYESGKPQRHLIAANLSVETVIDTVLANTASSKIDIINSHYVRLYGSQPGVLEADRYSAIKLLLSYNLYNNAGAQGLNNKAIWGFNETHITGLTGGNFQAFPDTVRAEAWQFMIDGGGQYNHLSYCWGNAASISGAQGTCPTTNADDPDALGARRQLGYLSRFLGSLPLSTMRRSTGNQTAFWLNAFPARNDVGCDANNFCWAAMQGGTRVLYLHHSTIWPNGGFRRYEPVKKASCPTSCLTSCTGTCPANCYRDTITVKNLGDFGTCTANFKAEWFTPDGTHKDIAGNLVPIPGMTHNFSVTGSGATATLPASPCYAYDLALKVTQTNTCP